MMAGESFKSWLYRPYIDLTPEAPEGNPQTKGLLLALASVKDETDRARIHGLYPTSWRNELFQQAGISDDLIPESFWDEVNTVQPGDQAVRIYWLLHRAFLHEKILYYTEEPKDLSNKIGSEVALIRAMARHALGKTPGFVRVAKESAAGSWAAIEATYFLAALTAKNTGDPDRVERWAVEHHNHILTAAPNIDNHDLSKLLSRYYRVHAFIPQFRNNNAEMIADMDKAEVFASGMDRDTEDHATEARTLTFAMLESRCKEALHIGDIALAIERALAAIRQAPLRPAGYLALGQSLAEDKDYERAITAYRTAARYGPPDTEVAWFSIGYCWEQLDAPDAAMEAYLAALNIDPLGISSYEQLIGVCDKLGDNVVGDWAKQNLSKLTPRTMSGATPEGG
jgi:tetratricopeptide (TPR) repeat protein